MCAFVCACVRVCVRVCVCVCVYACACVGGCVSVAIGIVKRPVHPLYVEDGRCRNFLYCYFFFKLLLLLPGQLSSGISSLFLNMTPAVTLAVTTVNTWLGPKRIVQHTF